MGYFGHNLNFGKLLINTTKDTCIINIASSRQILDYINKTLWFSQTEEEKKAI
jgi:hypothetical protein